MEGELVGKPRSTTSFFEESGQASSKRRYNGKVYDAYIPKLSGHQAVRTYGEMINNDPVVGATLFAVEMLIRGVNWWAEPSDESDPEAVEAAEHLQSCMDDMEEEWDDVIAEVVSMFGYGYSLLEPVYKIRHGHNDNESQHSKYSDGLIGWSSMPPRSQESVMQWHFDIPNNPDRILGLDQQTDYGMAFIPYEKLLLFRPKPNMRAPEGRSILRNSYRPWYLKRHLEEIEGIGVERELAGLPTLTAPEETDIWDADDPKMTQMRNDANQLLSNVKANEAEGILLPNGWAFALVSSGGQRAIDISQVIERYDRRIAMTSLADFILIGHESTGSFALADTKTNLFGTANGSWVDSIANVFNRGAVRRLFKLNQRFNPEKIPHIAHGDLESPNLAELADYINKLVGAGVLEPGDELENDVRDKGGLPKKSPRKIENDPDPDEGLGGGNEPTINNDPEGIGQGV